MAADGFAPIAREARQEGFAPTFLIAALDAARREAAAAPPPAPPPGPDPTEMLIAEAHAAGREEGHAAALRAAAEDNAALAARAAAMAAEALRQGQDAAAAAAEEVASGLARVALAMLDAALPGLAAGHAGPLAAEFARRLAPVLQTEAQARIFVAPGLAAETAALLGAEGLTIEEDAALAPGDARAEWRAGGAALDLAARRREIRRVLQSAGLGLEE